MSVSSIEPWRVAARRRLKSLEGLQAKRLEMIAARIVEFDNIVARHQREIDNLRSTLEVDEG